MKRKEIRDRIFKLMDDVQNHLKNDQYLKFQLFLNRENYVLLIKFEFQ